MKLKEQLFRTDFFLQAGLFMAFLKACNMLTVVLNIPEMLDSMLTLGMCGCYSLHVLLQRPSFKRLGVYGIAVLIGMYSALRSGDMMGLNTMFTCIALAGCDFERIMEKLFRWNACFFVLNVTASLTMALIDGPMINLIHIYEGGKWGDWAIHFGFGHKNNLGLHLISTFLMWIWTHYDRLKIKPVLIFSCTTCVFFYFAQCRAACGILALLTVLLVYFKQTDHKTYPIVKKLVQWAAALGPAALFTFSFGSAWLYRQHFDFIRPINAFTNGRISLCAKAWEQYGLTFFGHLASDIAQVEGRVLLMDNTYMYSMVQIGAIWALAFCIAFFLLARRSKDVRVYLCILCWCMYSAVEITVLHGLFFIPGILPALLLWPDKKNKDMAAS